MDHVPRASMCNTFCVSIEAMAWPSEPEGHAIFIDMRLDMAPVSKGRPKATARGGHVRTYTPKRTREYEEEIGLRLRAAKVQRNELDDLGVHVVFHMKGRKKSDVDNLCKALLDGCNGIAWRDDQQVVQLAASVVYNATEPHTRFRAYVVERRGRPCAKCGKPLTLRQISNNQVFCGKGCFDGEQRHLRMTRVCCTCGKNVERRPSKAESLTVFCSPECRTARRGNCRTCGAQLATPPSARRPFCSAECSAAWYEAEPLKVKARGSCSECGGPTSGRSLRCRGCYVKAVRAGKAGRWKS